jgi:Tfp pilus assembly protein PilV
MLELLISLTVLIIGVAAIMSLQVAGMRASAFSRHAQEATVLAEDLLEALRTIDPANLATGGPETIDERGMADVDGFYTREWEVVLTPDVTDDPELVLITVTVSWQEQGGDAQSIELRTERQP